MRTLDRTRGIGATSMAGSGFARAFTSITLAAPSRRRPHISRR
jgi:hypothetical protein